MKIIKKYHNRCLYDSEISANITTQDLKKFVIDGIAFKVINAKTGEDITRSYLIQIILELECLDSKLFSQEALEYIIRCNGGDLQAWFKQYLEQSLSVMAMNGVKNGQSTEAKQQAFVDTLSELTAKSFEFWQQSLVATYKK